jgi:mitogen-activated protein kinase 1/3
MNVFDDLIDAKRILREITLLRKLKNENLITFIELLPPKDWDNFNEVYMVNFI